MRGRYALAAGYTKMNLINRAVKIARGYANEIVYVYHSLKKIFEDLKEHSEGNNYD